MMFWFQLWREFKLSVAEIFSVFGEFSVVELTTDFLIVSWISKETILEKAKILGWTIKIIEILTTWTDHQEVLEEKLVIPWFEGKYTYALNIFGKTDIWLKTVLKTSKEIIKSSNLNPRFVNKDFKNIASVVVIKEALVKKATDFNMIFSNDKIYFWNTIWVQNIYWYSNRDYWKERNMFVWMLPPKLAQMMINLANNSQKSEFVVYDPFVWLWTVLIESVNMWNKKFFWTDLNPEMARVSKENVLKINKDLDVTTLTQNSKYISEIDFINNVDVIVTEWYLWEIMTQKNINLDRINKQTEKLADLYEWFFSWLNKLNFKGNIVISFPFWEMNKKYFYFDKIYDIIEKYCIINELLPRNLDIQTTKSWSLLYKRKDQLVWREIFSLKLK